ncbi:MAG: hypothetical protein P1Q69_09545 [Candidatus Thorarchaeota archaeon]|nr:hypothetical protein [Candidatus Thorarchaeota archaeon]
MIDEKSERTDDAEDMSSAIVSAVEEEERKNDDEDALSRNERRVELTKEEERIQKAKQLKKELRKRELGILRYRWPTVVLFVSGIFAIITQFLAVWTQVSAFYGFNTYWEAFLFNTNIFWLFPMISGIILIVMAFFAYSRPKATYFGVVPAMMMAMAGSMPYFLIELVAVGIPDFANEIVATGTPIEMFVVAILALLAIAIREKE